MRARLSDNDDDKGAASEVAPPADSDLDGDCGNPDADGLGLASGSLAMSAEELAANELDAKHANAKGKEKEENSRAKEPQIADSEEREDHRERKETGKEKEESEGKESSKEKGSEEESERNEKEIADALAGLDFATAARSVRVYLIRSAHRLLPRPRSLT